MAEVNQKPLTTVQKVGRFFLYMSGAAFLVGIAPYLLMLLLVAAHIIDTGFKFGFGLGIVFLFSCPVVIVLMLIGLFCRFLISD
jgi:hypothetical protein